jgi:hypothetical protein
MAKEQSIAKRLKLKISGGRFLAALLCTIIFTVMWSLTYGECYAGAILAAWGFYGVEKTSSKKWDNQRADLYGD